MKLPLRRRCVISWFGLEENCTDPMCFSVGGMLSGMLKFGTVREQENWVSRSSVAPH